MTARYVFTCDKCGAEGDELELEILTFRDPSMDVTGHICGACIAALDWQPGTRIDGKAAAIRFRARPHAASCHCNKCIGAPAGIPSEPIVYAEP